MKKIIFASLVLLAVAVIALATGVQNTGPSPLVGNNPQQTGTVIFTNATPAVYTNTVTFPYPYLVSPVGVVYNLSTNAANEPMTNTFTTTNLTIVSTATNTSFQWFANLGYPRIETGVAISLAATPTNIAFPVPFFYPPVVTASPSVTNSTLDVESVTTSNFTLRCSSLSTNQWSAFGVSANNGVAMPPVLNQ